MATKTHISHIKYCVAYTETKKDGKHIDSFKNFETKKEALDFYNEVLQKDDLYTANLCEVIDSTG